MFDFYSDLENVRDLVVDGVKFSELPWCGWAVQSERLCTVGDLNMKHNFPSLLVDPNIKSYF